VFRRTARGSTCHQLDGFWEGPGFSRAVTIHMNPGLQPLRDLPTRRRERARQKIDSQRTPRRREQTRVFPTARIRPAEDLRQGTLGRPPSRVK